jgi:ferric-dicitrate binding protein FerR (iron transport regulator)
MPPASDPTPRAPNAAVDAAAERDRQAAAALNRVERESETVASSTLPRAGMRAADDDADEAVVRWGKRLGRSLGIAVALFLLWKVMGILFFAQGATP